MGWYLAYPVYQRKMLRTRGLSIIATEWKRPTKKKGKKGQEMHTQNKAQQSKLFLRKLHVIDTTIYGIKYS